MPLNLVHDKQTLADSDTMVYAMRHITAMLHMCYVIYTHMCYDTRHNKNIVDIHAYHNASNKSQHILQPHRCQERSDGQQCHQCSKGLRQALRDTTDIVDCMAGDDDKPLKGKGWTFRVYLRYTQRGGNANNLLQSCVGTSSLYLAGVAEKTWLLHGGKTSTSANLFTAQMHVGILIQRMAPC